MIATVGAEIRIVPNEDQAKVNALERTLKPLLWFDNPEYAKRVQMGKWAGNTPKYISLMRKEGQALIIPFGMLPWLFGHRCQFDAISSEFGPVRAFKYDSAIKLYEYQESAVQAALKARQGVIVAPCGSGKTQIGLELIARIGGRALWITHTSDLLNQSMDRAKNVFGADPQSYGTITGGRMNVGQSITFSTVQTLCRVDLNTIRDCFDVVVVDECHHCVGTPTQVTMFSKVISAINARFKFGLTATPKRADGLTPCMYALLGEKVYEIMQEDVSSTTCPVCVKMYPTSFEPDFKKIIMPDGTLSYHRLISEVTNDADRNIFVSTVAAMSEFPCLVLTDRVAHVETLAKLTRTFRQGRNVACLQGAVSKESRKELIRKLESGDIQILVATFALAKEGLDIPSLRTLILATPQKNETAIVQSTGRVARCSPEKEIGTVVDFEDIKFPMFSRWAKKRKALYKRMGFSLRDEQ